jgi:translocation and assembly module TamB
MARTRLAALALAALLAVGLGAAAQTPAPAVAPAATAPTAEDAEKSAFVRFVEETISTPDRRIRLGGIDGALSSDVRIGSITLADRDGVWLEITDAHLVWSRLALLKGRLEIDELTAAAIRLDRRPRASSTPSATASPGFALPELPVSVRLGRLAVPDVTLAEGIAGSAARFAVDGGAQLDGDLLDARFAVRRLDAGGRLDFRLGYREADRVLDLDLALDEPNGGFLTNLLDIRDRPALALGVRGRGPVDGFSADLTLDADGKRLLTGRGAVASAAQGRRYTLRVDGSLGRLVSDRWGAYFAGRTSLDVAVAEAESGGAVLERAELVSGAASLRAVGTFAADGVPIALTLAGELGSGDAVVPIPGTEGRAKRASLAVVFGDRAPWKGTLRLDGFESDALRLRSAEIVATGVARDLADGKRRGTSFEIEGGLDGLASPRPGEAPAFRSPLRLAARGEWRAGAPITIATSTLDDGNVAARFAGTIGAGEIAGAGGFAAKTLTPLSGLAGRRLGGRVDLSARGTWHLLRGAFDVTLDGESVDLAAGSAEADALMRGRTTLRGRVARTTEGLTVEGVALDNRSLRLAAAGTLGRTTGDLSLSAAIHDLGVATAKAKGRVALEARATGGLARPTIVAALTAPSLTLQGRPLRGGEARFDGVFGEKGLDGRFALTGDLAGRRLTGGAAIVAREDGGSRLDGLRIVAGRSRIEGTLDLAPGGLVDGALSIASPDLADLAPLAFVAAKGTLDASVTLAGRDGVQNATARGRARSLVVEGAAVGAADFDVALSDVLGAPTISGRMNASRMAAPGVDVAKVEARASPAGGRATRFDLRADGIATPDLRGAGLAPAAVTATGTFVDRDLRFEATARAGGGVALTARGRSAIDGSDLAVTVTGDVPLAAANGSLRERATKLVGRARLDLSIAGSAAAPRIGGAVALSGVGVTDPETGIRLVSGSGRIRIADGRATVESFSITTGTAGTISLSGTVDLPPARGLPADLTVRLARARIRNGDLLTAQTSGLLTLRGRLLDGPTIGGAITVDRAEIAVPERFVGRVAVIDTEHRGASKSVARTIAKARGPERRGSKTRAAGFALALSVEAPARIFVRGRGLDAELGGRLRLDGPVDRLAPVGAFEMIRGRLDVAGQRIDLTRGRVQLVGSLDPEIDFAAETRRGSLTVTARVHGAASDPRISLSASEDLPQDEILARFLFGRSITQLSPVQVVRLTVAVAQLAGGGQAADLLGSIRKSTGLDDLDIVTDAKGNTAVKAGRYVGENVYLGVKTGAKGEAAGTINLDVTRNLKIRGETGTEDSRLGVFFEREY